MIDVHPLRFKSGLRRHLAWPLSALLPALAPHAADALQPLAEFEAAAKDRAFDNQEARALAEQRVVEAQQAWHALVPSVSAQADLLRNQYTAAAAIPTGPGGATQIAVFTPQNQRDLTVTATLPLVDFTRWQSIRTSGARREGQRAAVVSTELDVANQVATNYYRIVGTEGVLVAAERTVKAASENADYIAARYTAGFASELDLLRARSEVERDRQAVADAEYTLATTRVALRTLTGVPPAPGAAATEEELADEPPLETWLSDVGTLPVVTAAVRVEDASRGVATGQRSLLLPSVSAQATERFTNAIGFGVSPYYSVGLVASWKLDLSSYTAGKADDAAAAVDRVRAERARAQASDSITNAWHEVRQQTAKCRAARAERAASKEAAVVAKQRYEAGKVTLLELVQAQRDDFTAEVASLQADADLAAARARLRLNAGRPLEIARGSL